MQTDKVAYARLDEGQKTMGLELAGVALTLVDYVADTVTPDALAAGIFGLTPDQPVSRDTFHARIHPEDRPAVLAEVDKLIDPDFDDTIEITHRTIAADGSVRWVQARKRLYRGQGDQAGVAVSGVAAILDITARRQAEETTGFLMRELQHRTQNVVTVISAMARMVMKAGPAEDFLERFEPRIANLAQNLKLRGAATHPDLRDTIDAALRPFLSGGRDNVTIDGPAVQVTPQQSQVYAIIIHELATNSVKHGALHQIGADVAVTWTTASDGSVHLRWHEARTLPATKPEKPGFGTQMLEQFAALSLNGQATQTFADYTYSYDLHVPAPVKAKPSPAAAKG